MSVYHKSRRRLQVILSRLNETLTKLENQTEINHRHLTLLTLTNYSQRLEEAILELNEMKPIKPEFQNLITITTSKIQHQYKILYKYLNTNIDVPTIEMIKLTESIMEALLRHLCLETRRFLLSSY